ncbi:putative Nucleotide exchange factor SIL1 [Hypsibius exemplaris]|uniref:Nucleotide exchange factor SIL1 n=1 Tax=Hypsibius exemplaris TaxID=2072580 RepID=A0A1W0XF87_HYPEX|nr:putative Nucleotide exchange factor SIL1 [Hypsibius exemplaris]
MEKLAVTQTALTLLVLTILFLNVLAEKPETFSPLPAEPEQLTVEDVGHSSIEMLAPQSGRDVFVPEKEWKQIKDGQAIPPGLHVRMNFQTGINEAKLMDAEEGSSADTSISVLPVDETAEGEKEAESAGGDPSGKTFFRADLERALRDIDKTGMLPGMEEAELSEKEKQKVRGKFRSMEELRKDFAEMNMQIQTDREILRDLIGKYHGKGGSVVTPTDVMEKLSFLTDLEYYVHQIDNARDFLDLGGMELVREALNESSPALRAEAAHIVGSAAQNNPAAQIHLLEHGVLPMLVKSVAAMAKWPGRDPSAHLVLSRSVYAVSALVRNFPMAQQRLVENGGIAGLEAILLNERLPKNIKGKAISLVADMLTERDDTKRAVLCGAGDSSDHALQQQRLEQYDASGLGDVLDGRWPSLLAEFLVDFRKAIATDSLPNSECATIDDQDKQSGVVPCVGRPQDLDAARNALKVASLLKHATRKHGDLTAEVHAVRRYFHQQVDVHRNSGETDELYLFTELVALSDSVLSHQEDTNAACGENLH